MLSAWQCQSFSIASGFSPPGICGVERFICVGRNPVEPVVPLDSGPFIRIYAVHLQGSLPTQNYYTPCWDEFIGMLPRRTFILLFILGALILTSYLIFFGDGGGATVHLGIEDNGSALRVERKTRVVIELEENPSTGYRWRPHPDQDFASLESDNYIPPENQVPGKPGLRSMEFRIMESGNLTLRYGRSWENRTKEKFWVHFRAD